MDKTQIERPRATPLKVRLRWPMRIGYVLGACSLCILGLYLYQRVVRGNFGTVVPGKVYRSAQPKPEQLKDWVRRYGIKTVINLRGERNPEYDGEVQAVAEAGAHLTVVKLSATRHPATEHMHDLVQAIEASPQPILLHCKEGADRAGVASVMAAMYIGGKSYDQAKDELTIIHFHIDTREDSIAGVLTEYEDCCTRRNLPHGGWEQFRQWAMNDYSYEYQPAVSHD
jgi:protein tyrosine/serine phosphatase